MGCISSSPNSGDSHSRSHEYSSLISPVVQNGYEIVDVNVEYKKSIEWSDIKLYSTNNPNSMILGNGGFGTIVKGLWLISPTVSNQVIEVAVKVIQKSSCEQEGDYDKVLKNIDTKVSTIRNAEKKIVYKDSIIRVYGICQGRLPLEITQLFQLNRDEPGIGMIMRLEKGGPLSNLIHSTSANKDQRPTEATRKLSMKDKVNLMFQIARAIAELHSIGVVHGDIKPANILTDTSWPPKLRLSDFGFAKNLEVKLAASSMAGTLTRTGTPCYNAPEMFADPKSASNQKEKETVARASRKTDIYSLAVVMWEILSEKEAFTEHYSELALTNHLRRGRREDLSLLPSDTPSGVIEVIQSCWDSDRKNRKTAIECVASLEPIDLILSQNKTVDVLIAPSSSDMPFFKIIFHYFVRHGFTVLFEDFDYHQVCGGEVEIVSQIIQSGNSFTPQKVEVLSNPLYENACNVLKNNYRVRLDNNDSDFSMFAIVGEQSGEHTSTSDIKLDIESNIKLDIEFLHKLVDTYKKESFKDLNLDFDSFFASDAANFDKMNQVFKCIVDILKK